MQQSTPPLDECLGALGLPEDLLLKICCFLSAEELCLLSTVCASLRDTLLRDSGGVAWRSSMRAWKYGGVAYCEQRQCGRSSPRWRSLVLEHLAIDMQCKGHLKSGSELPRDIRSLDVLINDLRYKLANEVFIPDYVGHDRAISLLSIFRQMCRDTATSSSSSGGTSCDSRVPTWPLVFCGEYMQMFDVRLPPGLSLYTQTQGELVRDVGYCRSDWMVSLLIAPRVSSSTSFSQPDAQGRIHIDALWCWKKLQQRSSPSLAAMGAAAASPSASHETIRTHEWMDGLYQGINKSAVSQAKGFYYIHTGQIVLSTTGRAWIRPNQVYPNVPGRRGL